MDAWIDDLSAARGENVVMVRRDFCKEMSNASIHEIRALFMMLSMYQLDASVFVNRDGELKTETQICQALIKYVKQNRSGWSMSTLRLPTRINKFILEMHSSLTGMVYATSAVALFLANLTTLVALTISAGLFHVVVQRIGILILDMWLRLIDTTGFTYGMRKAIRKAFAVAQEVELLEAPDLTLKGVGDRELFEWCEEAHENGTSMSHFRRRLVRKSKKWFRGRQVRAIHMFSVDGEPRGATQTCVAFMKYKGVWGENMLGF